MFPHRDFSNTQIPVYQRLKLTKCGHREASAQRVCGMSFEELPLWFWAVRLAEWSEIHITDVDEVRLRQYHLSTWEFAQSKLVIIGEDKVLANGSREDVWLVSGSLAFIQGWENRVDVPTVGWISDGGRRKPNSVGSRWTWSLVSHAMVGGVTKATGIFGTIGVKSVAIANDPIRRSIGHVIKYSERPKPCTPPVITQHYTVDDLLSLHQLDRPVVFKSGFSRSGWGLRKLVNTELAHAFDLPAFVSWESVTDEKVVPIHMFRVVLDAVLEQIGPATQERAGQRQKLQAPSLPSTTIVEALPLPLDRAWLDDLGTWLPGSWTDITIANKAVKSDNAVVDFYPWHQRIMLVLPCPPKAIVSFEEFALRIWRRNVTSSFLRYMATTHGDNWATRVNTISRVVPTRAPGSVKRRRVHTKLPDSVNNQGVKNKGEETEMAKEKAKELERDIFKGCLVLRQVLQSKWWEWTFGSALFFWRWNGTEQIMAAREGMRMYVRTPLPVNRNRMKKVTLSSEIKALVAEKIEGMGKRFYLEASGHVSNSLNYFAVPKGETDIRVVFDGTACGLNDTLWAPNFFLPSATSAAMLLTFGTWMADMDFGEMFHNFPMEERMRKHAGVKFETKTSGGGRVTKMLRWTRLFMGMRPSPYNAIRYYYWGEEFARGNPARSENPMGYDCIRLNLPGMHSFDPLLPKVMKWRTALGVVAGDVLTFVDDVRITGYSKENCHEVHHQFASRIQYLGMQDAPRKFRPPSQLQAGAWTGTIFKISPTTISKSVSQEKWEKGKAMIAQLLGLIETAVNRRPLIERKKLEKETGFLNHLSMTFDVITPFLKGFYLTLNSWRSQRDEGDWKMSDKRWKRLLFSKFERGDISEAELDTELFGKEETTAPLMVTGSISLADDVAALAVIFAPVRVPVVRLRSKHVITVVYGFGDASGTGLGATFTCGAGLNFRIGVWGAKEDPESSNWKEFTNVVEALEEEGDEGNLDNAEVFMFTDNSTVEACVSRGSSSSPKLLELVV
ncbi:hypothetical protein MHU86_15498 [Fragilaria crotonensis]|nr:hypothetical protein MHU86_15498 [Fragilaria crotonensis]